MLAARDAGVRDGVSMLAACSCHADRAVSLHMTGRGTFRPRPHSLLPTPLFDIAVASAQSRTRPTKLDREHRSAASLSRRRPAAVRQAPIAGSADPTRGRTLFEGLTDGG